MQKRPTKTTTTTTTATIESYLKRCKKDRLLVVSHAVTGVRSELPDCELIDAELAELIALHAVAAGFTMIAFDLNARRYSIELPVAWSVPGWPILGSGASRREIKPALDILPDPDPSEPPAGN